MAYPAAIHDALDAELQSLREKGSSRRSA